MDPRNGGSWKCIDASEIAICPGKFNTGMASNPRVVLKIYVAECACNGDAETCPIGDCECEGQLRVSEDCKTAK